MPLSNRKRPLEIEYVETGSLTPNPRNARKHNRRQLNKIAGSIEKLGWASPLVIDENGIVLCGNGRLAAAIQLGLARVPCVKVSDLSDAEKTALALADNRIGDESSFDDGIVKSLLMELAGLEFDIGLTGFDMGEIDFSIDGAPGAVIADAADATLPLATIGAATSRPGDLWWLGKHRLFCGSSLEDASYSRLLGSDLARMIFTDAPYNVRITGHVSGKGKVQHPEFAQASGEMSRPEFREFLLKSHRLMANYSVDGAIHMSCMDWRSIDVLTAIGEQVYAELKNICLWVKSNAGMGSLYRSQYEFVAVFKKGKAPHINNVELGRHGRNRSNVWDYAGVNSFGPTRDADLAAHPTVKPVALVADAIRDCSNRGDIILDAFSGSGTTILACERTGRRGAAIEIDPIYVDVAIRRWEKLTGKAATLDSDGRTFADLVLERSSNQEASQ